MRLCVIGDPVGHSLSPLLHRRMLDRAGLTGSYETVTVTPDTLPEFLAAARAGAWDGCNITMPLKQAILPLLDELDPIEASYIFEVSSAGAERPLKRPSDFQQFMGSPVLLKTYKPVNGRKEFAGRLAGYDNGAVELDMGTAQPLRFEKQDIALVRLRVEF